MFKSQSTPWFSVLWDSPLLVWLSLRPEHLCFSCPREYDSYLHPAGENHSPSKGVAEKVLEPLVALFQGNFPPILLLGTEPWCDLRRGMRYPQFQKRPDTLAFGWLPSHWLLQAVRAHLSPLSSVRFTHPLPLF